MQSLHFVTKEAKAKKRPKERKSYNKGTKSVGLKRHQRPENNAEVYNTYQFTSVLWATP